MKSANVSSAAEPASPTYPTRAQAALGIGVLALIGFGLTTDVALTSLLIEPMKRDLALSDVQVALVQGTAYGSALGLGSLPAGRLVDRLSRRGLIAGGLAIWSVALAAIGLAEDVATLAAARAALGLMAALVVPASFSLAADLRPPERRAVSTSLLVVGQALGQGVGVLAGGLLFDALGRWAGPGAPAPWRVLYGGAAALGLVLLAVAAALREPARHERASTAIDLGTAVTGLWSLRRFYLPLLGGLLFAQVAIQAASTWASPLLIRRGLSPGAFAGWLGPLLLVCGVVGALAGGWLAERGRRRLGRTGVLAAAALAALLIAPGSLFALSAPLPLFAGLLALDVLAGAVVATIGVIAMTLAIPNDLRGLALGASTFAAAIVAAAGAPAVVALISRSLGGEAMLGPALALVSGPSALLSAACFAAAAHGGTPDAKKHL